MKLVVVIIVEISFLINSIHKDFIFYNDVIKLNDLSRLDSSVRYLNLNLESPTSKFEVVWYLRWNFELKSFFVIFFSSTAMKGTFMLVYISHSHLHLSFLLSCISASFSLKYCCTKDFFIDCFILLIGYIRCCSFCFAFNFCNIFDNTNFRHSTLNQNLM